MNGIVEFFSEYGWIALAVTVISAAAGVLLNFIAKDKLSRGVKDVIPTISAIILETTADMLFVKKAFVFDANAVYTGIICGSLATAVAAFVVKIAEGRVTTKDVTDFVAELIEGFIVICQTFFSSFLKIFEIFFRKCRKHRKNTIKKPLSLLIITFPKKKVNRIA